MSHLGTVDSSIAGRPGKGIGLILALFLILQPLGAQSFIGSVKAVNGAAAVRRDGQALPAKEGFRLQEKDALETAAGGALTAILQDGTRISLGPETTLVLDRYLYNPAQSQFDLLLRMVRGVGAFVSGKIAQFAPDRFRMETPVGVVGLRGTEFVVQLEAGEQ